MRLVARRRRRRAFLLMPRQAQPVTAVAAMPTAKAGSRISPATEAFQSLLSSSHCVHRTNVHVTVRVSRGAGAVVAAGGKRHGHRAMAVPRMKPGHANSGSSFGGNIFNID